MAGGARGAADAPDASAPGGGDKKTYIPRELVVEGTEIRVDDDTAVLQVTKRRGFHSVLWPIFTTAMAISPAFDHRQLPSTSH